MGVFIRHPDGIMIPNGSEALVSVSKKAADRASDPLHSADKLILYYMQGFIINRLAKEQRSANQKWFA